MGRRLNKSEIQTTCCGILSYIKQVCDANDITYYLAFGTCLGAVRHHGFIPWDDDVDIYMLREDYRKFSNIMSLQPADSRYKLVYYDITPEYKQPLPKVYDTKTTLIETSYNQIPIGVYVDVFVLDNVPDKENVRQEFFYQVQKKQDNWALHYIDPKYMFKNLKFFPFLKFIVKRIIYKNVSAENIDKFAQQYNVSNTRLVGNLTEPCYPCDKIAIDKGLLGNGCDLEFEGEIYRGPEKYDEYLTQIYGDYMTLPPEEKRIYHNTNYACFKN